MSEFSSAFWDFVRIFGLRIGIISALKSALSALKIGTQSTSQSAGARSTTGKWPECVHQESVLSMHEFQTF